MKKKVFGYNRLFEQMLRKKNIPVRRIRLIKKNFMNKGIKDISLILIINKWLEMGVPFQKILNLVHRIEVHRIRIFEGQEFYNNKVFLVNEESFLDPVNNQMYLKFKNSKYEQNFVSDTKTRRIFTHQNIYEAAKNYYLENRFHKAILFYNFLIQQSEILPEYFSEEIIFEIFFYTGNSYLAIYNDKESLRKMIKFYRKTKHFLFLKYIAFLLFFLDRFYFSKIFVLQYKRKIENLDKKFKERLKKMKINLDIEERRIKYLLFLIDQKKKNIY